MDQFIDERFVDSRVHLGRLQNEGWEPLYSDEFVIDPPTLFEVAFSDDFVHGIHQERESTALTIGPWSVDNDSESAPNQPITWQRSIQYISKLPDSQPFLPSHTEVFETQRFRFYGRSKLVVDTSISTPVRCI